MVHFHISLRLSLPSGSTHSCCYEFNYYIVLTSYYRTETSPPSHIFFFFSHDIDLLYKTSCFIEGPTCFQKCLIISWWYHLTCPSVPYFSCEVVVGSGDLIRLTFHVFGRNVSRLMLCIWHWSISGSRRSGFPVVSGQIWSLASFRWCLPYLSFIKGHFFPLYG